MHFHSLVFPLLTRIWVNIWGCGISHARPLFFACVVHVLSECGEYCVWCVAKCEYIIFYCDVCVNTISLYLFALYLVPLFYSRLLFSPLSKNIHTYVRLCELLHFIWSHNCCYLFLSISEDRQHSPKIQYTQWMKWRYEMRRATEMENEQERDERIAI